MSNGWRLKFLDSLPPSSACTVPLEEAPLGVDVPFLQWIVRYRWVLFAAVVLLQLAAFHGQWRISRDGAHYRLVAQSLARGQGYRYLGQPERHVYPGLPLLLAAVERVFGPEPKLRPTVSLTLMLGMMGLILAATYHLVRLQFPEWLAVAVTFAVGTNHELLEHVEDLMADVPFLLGVMLALLGAGLSGRGDTGMSRWWAIGMGLVGAMLALSMRPTFWALALPWLGLCVWGIATSARRWWYLAALLLALGVLGLWVMLDPRIAGWDILAGRYEQRLLERLGSLRSVAWGQRFLLTFEKHLPMAVFGLELLFPAGTLFTGAVVVSLLRQRSVPLWGLYVLTTLGMTYVMGSRPRYFLMILPLVLVGWGLVLAAAARRAARWRDLPQWLMVAGLGLVWIPNVVRSIGLVMEHRGLTRRFEYRGFLAVYRDGSVLPICRLSMLVRQHVPAGHVVLGPEEAISTFLSDRRVIDPGPLLRRKGRSEWPEVLRKTQAQYVVYGSGLSEYRLLNRLVNRGVVLVSRTIAVDPGGICLAKLEIPEKQLGKTAAEHQRPSKPTRPQKQRSGQGLQGRTGP